MRGTGVVVGVLDTRWCKVGLGGCAGGAVNDTPCNHGNTMNMKKMSGEENCLYLPLIRIAPSSSSTRSLLSLNGRCNIVGQPMNMLYNAQCRHALLLTPLLGIH